MDDRQASDSPEISETDVAAKRSQPTEADRRRQRSAEKLRENLLRRKAQQRSRRTGQIADDAAGSAANSTKDDE